jgi:hypothetical protein
MRKACERPWICFKGDCEDLSDKEYETIAGEAEEILNDCEGKFEWEDV